MTIFWKQSIMNMILSDFLKKVNSGKFLLCVTKAVAPCMFLSIFQETVRYIESFLPYTVPICRRSWKLVRRRARQITRKLCSALWVLHSMGVVHRDVKPENIIIRGKEAVLIDFDASRIYKNNNREDTQILGTTGYAAPEQYGLSQSDGRADIYALGILLNIMLTGEHPSRKLAGGRMGRIVQKCTMVSPEKRYKNILHLMEIL